MVRPDELDLLELLLELMHADRDAELDRELRTVAGDRLQALDVDSPTP